MKIENLKSSGSVMIKASNYNRWQFEKFLPFVKGRVLEIGCGAGNITELIAATNLDIVSVDIKKEAVLFTKKRIKKKNVSIKNVDIFSKKIMNELGAFDTIIFSNVLEHIKADHSALRYCYKYLRNSTSKLILLVPAHQFIYGTLDKEVGHYKRYNKKMVKELAAKTNFDIKDIYYFNFVGAIGWFINYKILKRKETNQDDSNLQVNFFDRFIVKPVKFIETYVRPPFGISLIAIMEKK